MFFRMGVAPGRKALGTDVQKYFRQKWGALLKQS